MNRWPRAVLHVDMDAFYVQVELLRRPELRGRPVVVGGTGRRGVVAAASYEARAFGIRSATPSLRARQLCPQAVFLPGDHARYGEVSAAVMAIFRRMTPLVEPLSLDEAFLDVTGAQARVGEPMVIAAQIRAEVADEVGLPCCVGLAPTKFLAKLGSQAAKPTPSPTGPIPGLGIKEIRPGAELEFLHPLPLRALWGVGPATLARLERLGIATVGELAALPRRAVTSAVGMAHGAHLWDLANGIDDREVEPSRELKSIGHEETYSEDLVERDACNREVVRLAEAVAARARAQGVGGRTVTMKVRYSEDFRTITRSHTEPTPVDSALVVARIAKTLLGGVDVEAGIRLLGVSLGALSDARERQLSLEDLLTEATTSTPSRSRADVDDAVDAIRQRFGASAIGPAALTEGGALRPLRADRSVWGPDSNDEG